MYKANIKTPQGELMAEAKINIKGKLLIMLLHLSLLYGLSSANCKCVHQIIVRVFNFCLNSMIPLVFKGC